MHVKPLGRSSRLTHRAAEACTSHSHWVGALAQKTIRSSLTLLASIGEVLTLLASMFRCDSEDAFMVQRSRCSPCGPTAQLVFRTLFGHRRHPGPGCGRSGHVSPTGTADGPTDQGLLRRRVAETRDLRTERANALALACAAWHIPWREETAMQCTGPVLFDE